MDIIELESDLGVTFSGLLVDEQGRLQALWNRTTSELKFALKQDLYYWPTSELKFDPVTVTWNRTTIKTVCDDF